MKFSFSKTNSQIVEIEKANESEKFAIGSGCCFGDWGILSNLPRSSSALALEDSFVLCLEKDKFLQTFGKAVGKANAEKVEFLKEVIPALNALSKQKMKEIYKKIYVLFFERNELIFKEDQAADNLFIVYQGSFEFFKKKRNSVESTLLTVGKGEFAGFEALQGKKQYSFGFRVLV